MRSPRVVQAITPELLLQAYSAGLFPMADSADDPRLFWLDPEIRGVFPLDGLHVSRSLRKAVRSERFEIVADRAFEHVIDGCAAAAPDRESTWINGTIRKLYHDLFRSGHVHTIEAYVDGQLVGGLYGVAIGGAFFGESMFHRETDASKVCLLYLAARLIAGGFTLLDAQFVTTHLATLGAVELPRTRYRERLAEALVRPARFTSPLQDGLRGESVLALIDGARAART